MRFVFIVSKIEGCRNILKLSCRPLAILKNKQGSGTNPLSQFLHNFWRNFFFLVMYYTFTKFHCLVAFTLWDIGQYLYCNCLLTRLHVMNFEINLTFLIKPFFLHDQKVMIKLDYLQQKELLRWNKKHFFIIFKGLSMKQITQIFLEGESPTLRNSETYAECSGVM